MENRRDQLADKLEKIIGKLYTEFDARASARDLGEMLEISDRITKAAEVLAHIYSAVELDEQVAMLEKAIAEAEG